MEFVLVMPLLFLLIVGVVEVAVMARTSLQLAVASREGARVAAAAPTRPGLSKRPDGCWATSSAHERGLRSGARPWSGSRPR